MAATLFTACSNDDDNPDPVNEEEEITTVTITFSPQGGGTDIVLSSVDADGEEGPNPPVITVSGDFTNGTTYDGSITFFNDLENEDITAEVSEEDDEHQVFYSVTGGVGTFAYNDMDADGNPVGLSFTFTAGGGTSGVLNATLRHEPDKNAAGVSDGDITNAGGETDISVNFNVASN